MPIIKSAKKKVRQSEKRRERNKALRTFMKSLRKKTLSIVMSDESSAEDIAQAVNLYKSRLDKAWAKGLYKRNKASRLKSKIDLMVSKKFKTNNQEAE